MTTATQQLRAYRQPSFFGMQCGDADTDHTRTMQNSHGRILFQVVIHQGESSAIAARTRQGVRVIPARAQAESSALH
jgi:hypothetical protein